MASILRKLERVGEAPGKYNSALSSPVLCSLASIPLEMPIKSRENALIIQSEGSSFQGKGKVRGGQGIRKAMPSLESLNLGLSRF